tara:strand:- start:270 stop:473 length:204 start_codon:yes stop_codon:yes gene_type:complete
MKNYTKYMDKINSMLDVPAKKEKTPASGFLAPSRVPKETKEDNSVDGQVAKYIAILREQKQEILRGK